MACWKAFGSPGVIGQVCDGNIPTRRVRIAVAPQRTSGTRPGAAMPGRRRNGGSAGHAWVPRSRPNGAVTTRDSREMVGGEWLGRVADPPEVPSLRTGLPPCPGRGHGARQWFGCLVGELRWVGASIGMSDGPGAGSGAALFVVLRELRAER